MFGVFQTQSFLVKITTVLPLIKRLYSKLLILKKDFQSSKFLGQKHFPAMKKLKFKTSHESIILDSLCFLRVLQILFFT